MRIIFGGPVLPLGLILRSLYASRSELTYSEAKRQFSDRYRDVLMNVQSPHKWWCTLKSAVFCSSSSLPPLVSEGGGLVCESVDKADLINRLFTNINDCCLLTSMDF